MPEPQTNGHAPVDADADLLASLRQRVEALTAQRDELQSQMDEITPHLKRYEKAILALEGKPLGNPSHAAPRTAMTARRHAAAGPRNLTASASARNAWRVSRPRCARLPPTATT